MRFRSSHSLTRRFLARILSSRSHSDGTVPRVFASAWRHWFVLAGLGLGAFCEGNVSAADAEPTVKTAPRWSLSDTCRIAFERNWDLLAADANVDLALAQKLVAREFPNPTFSLNSGKVGLPLTRGDGTTNGNRIWDRSYDTVAAISQLFEIGGKRSARKLSAQAGVELAQETLKDARRTLDQAVSKAYIAALQAEANVAIYRETADSLRREAKIAEARLEAGDISAADKAQIEIAASRAELDAEASKSNAVLAKIALEVLLGVQKPKGDWVPADNLERLAALSSEKSDARQRPDLVAAQAALKKAEADLRLQKAMRIPDPTIQLQIEHQPPNPANSVGLGISIPLPFERNEGNIRAALAAREQARTQLGKTEVQVASDIISSQVALSEAQKRWKRYQEEIQPHSAQVLQTVEYAYQKGKAALLDLLAAQRTNNDVKLATAQSMTDTATAAVSLAIAENRSFSIDRNAYEQPKNNHGKAKR